MMTAEDTIDDLPSAHGEGVTNSRWDRVGAGIGASAMAGAAAVGTYFDPSQSNFFPVCPLYSATGFACPGCGLTRGFHALFHGDLLTALDYNALLPIWAVVFVYVGLSLLLLAIRGRGLPMWPTDSRFMWGFVIVLFVFGVLRNVPVYPLSVLFP
jgi:hypothetical protein